ncbi:MAG: hypothetical protein RLZZ399_1961 [Verrucomicrobiota bacterium]|jgi:glycosyltransferase involved in cell wall biosynthesis
MSARVTVFLINLLQDVNIVRPLAYLSAQSLRQKVHFLISHKFLERDLQGVWKKELETIQNELGATFSVYEDEYAAYEILKNQSGLLIAGSESNLAAHSLTHNVFRVAPSSFLKVTLQHGFECVGFLQSRDQDLAHGTQITFGADVICGWCAPERLTAMPPSERSKLYVTGPSAVLQMPVSGKKGEKSGYGLVCENMHSPRLNVAGDFKTDFLTVFSEYCASLEREGSRVALRPHPGGQYTLKNKVALPENVILNNHPIYRVDLSRYAYGISAPSSILIDMILAGIPVAVWQDGGGRMDLGNYQGLHRVSTVADWLEFTRLAVSNPKPFLKAQAKFLEDQRLKTDPVSVRDCYRLILSAGFSVGPSVRLGNPRRPQRVLFVANGYIPTLQLSFIKPLAALIQEGQIQTDFLSEEMIRRRFKSTVRDAEVQAWIRSYIEKFEPTTVVFCRYSGPWAAHMMECAECLGAAVIYHIDDDLLHLPEDIGASKYKFHNDPARLATVRHLLDHSNLVYCSTQKLKSRLEELNIQSPIVSGDIYCSGSVIREPVLKPVEKIGYMGIGHEKNLEYVLPAIIRLLRKYPDLKFELFGTIPMPSDFVEFGDRISKAPKIDDYNHFLQTFAGYNWDVGICPLTPIPFNLVKANTKWVEYTSVGVAVVASRSTVYDECCSDECGLLAESVDEWFEALDALISSPEKRFQMVVRAQHKLKRHFSVDALRRQVLEVFDKASSSMV